ncbi:peptidoglycan recognition protein [Streptomyces sp. NPDC059816]|uniref:peptidoglycan recognition protein family protein n=1 Tax=Streptomyces sp. NPDC059816 TaxID=3346960 RepID=UPI00366196E4
MRGFIASSIGVTCAIALTFPLTLPSGAQAAPRGTDTAPPGPRPGAPAADPAPLPGSTQSLPLTARPATRSLAPVAQERSLVGRNVRPFSLLGVVWDDVRTVLDGEVQVRTRATGTGTWSGWRSVHAHADTHGHDHAADPGSAEARSGRVRGATAPLWVGDCDGVEVRVTGHSHQDAHRPAPLPEGLRLELVDPGPEPAPDRATGTRAVPGAASASASAGRRAAASADVPGAYEIPEVPELGDLSHLSDLSDPLGIDQARAPAAAGPHTAPRPKIVSRKKWGADESLRESGFGYTNSVKAAFVHHSFTGNNYRCSQAPSVIRGIYRYHVVSSGWRDIGYNFLVDKCGTVYEGRAGGVSKAVLGAHTLGFNSNTTGIAVLGSYGSTTPPAAVVKGIAKVAAWKLGLYGVNPKAKTYLTSGGGNLYRKGEKVRLQVISGHRDGFATECPGARLYGKLGTARSSAARLQGR